MKYKRQISTGMFALTFLLGGSSYLESSEVRNSKLGIYKNQVQMRPVYHEEDSSKNFKKRE